MNTKCHPTGFGSKEKQLTLVPDQIYCFNVVKKGNPLVTKLQWEMPLYQPF